jgi:hypothetical protein
MLITPKEWIDQHLKISRETNAVLTVETMLDVELAKELLSRNPENRNISQSLVSSICSDIQAGRFTFNGEPIIVSKEGLLNDGQHRCLAVTLTAMPIRVLIVFGVSRESRTTVDQGRNRYASDFLHMKGITQARQRASVAVLLINYEKYGHLNLVSSMASNRSPFTRADVVSRASTDDKLESCINEVSGQKRIGPFGGVEAVLIFSHYLFRNISHDDALDFLDKLKTGSNLEPNHPILALRNLDFRRHLKKQQVKAEALFRTWNAVRENRPLTRISLSVTKDKLPTLV